MSAIDSRAKLILASKKLMANWHEVRETWRDENARQFEKKYMAVLELNVRAAILAMERMGNAIESAHHDCKDDARVGL